MKHSSTDKPPKVLVVSASHSMERSQTSLLLNPFISGMEKAGAKVEILYLKRLNLTPCKADLACWYKHPGTCIHNDKIHVFKDLVLDKDILIIACPIFTGGTSSTLQIFLERTLPLILPDFILHKKHYGHKMRHANLPSKLILISTCAFYEMDNFKPIVSLMKSYAHGGSFDYGGALLRPHFNCIKQLFETDAYPKDIFDAASLAGYDYIKTGKIPKKYIDIIKRPLMGKKEYLQMVNNEIKALLNKNMIK